MDIVRAGELIRIVADGINPFTGEVLPADSVCNQPDMIRVLHCILEELEKRPAKAEKKPLPENAGKPWDENDDGVLADMFDNGCSVKKMQEHFKRTRSAIAARLVHIGKIDLRHQVK